MFLEADSDGANGICFLSHRDALWDVIGDVEVGAELLPGARVLCPRDEDGIHRFP